MEREVLLLGDPALYEISEEVKKEELPEILKLRVDLEDTIRAYRRRYGKGRAIAAPQIGVKKRVICRLIDTPILFINPVLEFPDDEVYEVWDDCMSFPGMYVRLLRHRRVNVSYLDERWEKRTLALEGDMAELIQHEYDHLDGILSVMRAIDERAFAFKNCMPPEKLPMITEELKERLFALQDLTYRDFQIKLIPGMEREKVIGVRTPALRALAKELRGRDDLVDFLRALPHRYFDEDQLHAFLISDMRDHRACLEELERFLPYIDNWATCDQLSPVCFKKHRRELRERIENWLASEQTYTIRFGIGMLMQHFLDEDFDPAYLERVAQIRSEEYYINMMIAWYFATALAKQYDAALPYLTENRLASWTHNKTIQKAIESFRVPQDHKDYLRTLRITAR